MKVIMNLGNSFSGMIKDVRREFGDDAEITVLALKRDTQPNEFRGQTELPLIERSGAQGSGASIVFIDDDDFNPASFGRDVHDAIVVMNGGTSRHGHASVRVYDGLEHGTLVDLQRDGKEVLEEK